MSGMYRERPDLDLTDRLINAANAASLHRQEPDEEDDEEDDDRKKEDADDDDEGDDGDDGYSERPCGTVTVLGEPDGGSAEQHMFFRFPQ
jgi:hypothetical protein